MARKLIKIFLLPLALCLAMVGSCATKKNPKGLRLSILYQGNVNGEIDPCG